MWKQTGTHKELELKLEISIYTAFHEGTNVRNHTCFPDPQARRYKSNECPSYTMITRLCDTPLVMTDV